MKTVALLLLLSAGVAAADPKKDEGSELVYGGGISFFVHAPSGWVLTSAGAASGIDAMYIEQEKSDEVRFTEFHAAVYARAEATHASLDKVVDAAIATAREQGPMRVVDKPAAWTCGTNAHGRRVTLLDEKAGTVATFIYLPETGAVAVIGMFAASEALWRAAKPELAELCASYQFVGKVTTPPAAARH